MFINYPVAGYAEETFVVREETAPLTNLPISLMAETEVGQIKRRENNIHIFINSVNNYRQLGVTESGMWLAIFTVKGFIDRFASV